jgi:hypothetical protein
MAWAAGNFTRANGATEWQDDAALGIGIEPGMHDAQDNDLATGINNCLTKDGQNTPTADLPMGAFKHTNVANATARNHYAAVGQVQDGDYIWLGTTGGTATAMTATATPAITAYKDGQKFRMKPGFDSTGAVYTSHSLNVNSLGAKSIIEQNGQSPTIGSWLTGTGRTLELVYNDGFFVVTSAPQYFTTWTPTLTPQNGTASGTAFSIAKYQRIGGNSCNITLRATWTQNTASANFIDITLPIRPSITLQGFDCIITTGASLKTGFAIISSSVGSGTVRCYDYDQSAILTGTKELILSGTYEIG